VNIYFGVKIRRVECFGASNMKPSMEPIKAPWGTVNSINYWMCAMLPPVVTLVMAKWRTEVAEFSPESDG
jgi:hypothetical protein